MPEVSRNSPCPCGSGKKYKRCCLKEEGSSPKSGTISVRPPAPSPGFLTIEMCANLTMNELIERYSSKGVAISLAWLEKHKKNLMFQLSLEHDLQTKEVRLYLHFMALEVSTDFYPTCDINFSSGVLNLWVRKGQIDFYPDRSLPAIFFHKLLAEDGLAFIEKFHPQSRLRELRVVLRTLFIKSSNIEKITLTSVASVANIFSINDLERIKGESQPRFNKIFSGIGQPANPIWIEEGDVTYCRRRRLIYRPNTTSDGDDFLKTLYEYNEAPYSHAYSSLALEFSDNTVISYMDLLCHPYWVLLKDEFGKAISAKNNLDYSEKASWPFKTPMANGNRYNSPFFRPYSEEYAKKTTDGFFQAIKKGYGDKINYWYMFASRDMAVKKLVEIKDWQIVTPRDYSVEVSSPFVTARPLDKSLLDDGLIYVRSDSDTLLLDMKQQKVYQIIVGDLMRYFRNTFYTLDPKSFSSVTLSSNYLHQLRANSFFTTSFDEFESELKRRYEIEISYDPQKVYSIADTQVEFHFTNRVPDKLAIKITGQGEIQGEKFELAAANLPYFYRVYFNLLSNGVSGFFDDKSGDLAKRQMGDVRQNDLKFLRHSGVALNMLYESMRLFHRNPEIKYNEFEKIILSYTAHLFKQILEKAKTFTPFSETTPASDIKLSNYCSKRVVDAYRNLLDSVYEDFSPMTIDEKIDHIFTEEKIVFVKLRQGVFTALSQILKSILMIHSANIFLKQKIKSLCFNMVENGDSKIFLSLSEIFDSTLNLADPAIKIFIDKQPLEMLLADDLSCSLEMANGNGGDGRIDWFELNPKIFFRGVEMNMSEREAFLSGNARLLPYQGKVYLIRQKDVPSLKWLNYFWKNLRGEASNKPNTFGDNSIVTIPRSKVLEMLALKEAGVPVIGNERWKKIEAEYEQLNTEKVGGDPSQIAFPPGLKVPLKPFQRIGTKWLRDLYALGLGGILADDMGLGKTIQAIALLEWQRLEKNLGKCLVVVPTSLVYNWVREFEKFAPEIPVLVFDGKEKAKYLEDMSEKVLIATYGLTGEHPDFFQSVEWNIVFYDEAQNLKNIKAKRTGEARKLVSNSKFCLTGTPMENHYGEYFSLIDLVVPQALGEYAEFMKKYSLGKFMQDETEKSSNGPSKEDIEFLKLKTHPLVLRRMKKEILDQLPEKNESVVTLPLEKEQKRIYRDIAIAWNDRVSATIEEQGGEGRARLEMLTALMRLRQVCSCPQIVPNIKYEQIPPKLELLIDNIVSLVEKNESVVVFTNFKMTLDYFAGELLARNVPLLTISGATSLNARYKILDDFNSDNNARVLLMTLKTGGVGLNLTKASYVFHIEPWWNPATENQATDRVHRMGQKNSVQVYRYIMQDSIEEKIQFLKTKKGLAFDALFAESEEDADFNHGLTAKYAKAGIAREDFQYLLQIQ
ncbi:MAG: hypothetical protein A2504_11710 [Bdellovibrionales bacterium RIFOXYD12_FULL_39_22]|nr:MAG: hypothetical protein A2385_16225 [Bdellovibrionales bacterium RIFOXYB1_FULL_39_21]OFZ44495.1 MAG: hypothetical protein A2485_06670 [Bdellovibrionales bacterium RIFOXYC12_FULL_39_17]OFZ49863.1 MAG: hypothetical protein A2404_00795 [Bdellovibrionales bacterium RIFOXYC1_FULL_39_130]OFZ72078.1 MAG: hypothetical protein A2451_11010 [Bdellovibrionales bacterium RIFOXYC2_FULL_39_8]OFZ76868.1 MAG: hypothetical protein A2560_05595 [Bdellovibrionales bacterium RIFOXYD1_FULL_39_84]OFZ95795.1 MAG: